MPLSALAFAGFLVGFEGLMQSQYGFAGALGCVLLTVGVEARNLTCGFLGAVVLAMLFV